MKNSLRYPLLFGNIKEFKIESDFPDTLYVLSICKKNIVYGIILSIISHFVSLVKIYLTWKVYISDAFCCFTDSMFSYLIARSAERLFCDSESFLPTLIKDTNHNTTLDNHGTLSY